MRQHETRACGLYACWLTCALGWLAACAVSPPTVSLGSRESDPSTSCTASAELLELNSSNRWKQLERIDCLIRVGQLANAAALLGALGDTFGRDRTLMEEVSGRLVRLLHQPGRLSSAPARVPLEHSALPVPTVRAKVASREGLLIWDSGNEFTALDQALCSQLGLPQVSGAGVQDSSGEVRGGSYIALLPHELALGPVQLGLPAVLCVDLSHVVTLEPRFIGVLGGNALGAESYQISPARSQLNLGAPLPEDLVLLEAEFQDGMPYIRADADGHSIQFLLDTGADFSTLSRATIDALELQVRTSGEPRTTYQGGGERTQSGERVVFRHLQSGSEVREGVEFRTGGTDLLGLDFIGDRTLVVDRDQGVVGLAP